MKFTGWQKTWIRILTTILTLSIMLMIFFFSTEDAEQSDQRSGVITDFTIKLVRPDYSRLSTETQQQIYDDISLIIRKCAHFTEYTLLGFFLRICLESWIGFRFGSMKPLSLTGFSVGALYACTDELHQIMIDGRSGQFGDVLLDSCGVLLGVILAMLLIHRTQLQIKDGG